MKKAILTLFILAVLFVSAEVQAQQSADSKTLTYEELYDNPYDIAKLFIHLQPIYGELFSTNTTAGIGLQAQYYHEDFFNIMVHGRTSYAQSFDLVKDAAMKNSTVANQPGSYFYFEGIGTYNIVDREEDVASKFILYSKRYKGDKWAATVPLHAMIPTKMRRVYGGRAGGMAYTTSVFYNRVLEKQGVTLTDMEGAPMESGHSVYGNMKAYGFFLGGSMTMIKNVAVQPDKIYGTLVNDLIFTAYFDFIITPFVTMDDIFINQPGTIDPIQYPADIIKTSFIGARVGLEGKFNRSIGFAYGIEAGYRPGLQGTGGYVTAKMSFPVFSTYLKHNVEAFGK